VIAGAEGEADARLSVITVGMVDRIETGEESGQLRGQFLRVQGALDLACEVFRHIAAPADRARDDSRAAPPRQSRHPARRRRDHATHGARRFHPCAVPPPRSGV